MGRGKVRDTAGTWWGWVTPHQISGGKRGSSGEPKDRYKGGETT